VNSVDLTPETENTTYADKTSAFEIILISFAEESQCNCEVKEKDSAPNFSLR
jgi:hypothetical protein